MQHDRDAARQTRSGSGAMAQGDHVGPAGTLFFGLARFMLLLLVPWSLALAGPSVSLVDAVARLDYGQPNGRPTLLLKVDGLDAQGLANPDLVKNVRDLPRPPGPPRVAETVEARELAPAGASSRSWLLTLDVKDLPQGSAQMRWLTLELDGKDATLSYTLTNTAAARFSWTVRGMPAVAIEPKQPIPLSVAVGPVPATGVTVLQSALVEKATKAPIAPNGLKVCASPDVKEGCTAVVVNLLPNSSSQLWLHGASGIGVYEGSVTIAAVEKPEGDSVPMTVSLSNTCRKVLGVTLILVGVVLAWICTVLVRNLINRNQLLLPASLTMQALGQLKEIVEAGKPEPKGIAERINRSLADLAPAKLEEQGLPTWIPALATSALAIDAYKRHVQGVSDWAFVLGILVHEGLVEAWAAREQAAGSNAGVEAAERAAAAVDDLAKVTTAPTPEAARKDVQAILTKMRTAVSAVTGKVAPPAEHAVASPEQLRVETARLGLLAWVAVLLATTLSGAYIVVLGPSGPGFGTPADFLLCLLWGVGLPTGAQLMQATTGSIATTFGVPRSTQG